jgi:NAD-reducing hydrogenase large subunit
LASPDLLFGIDADPVTRNVIGIALQHPELARQAILMRKYGQEIIAATAGKKIHGTGAIPGGINKNLSLAERDAFIYGIGGDKDLSIDKMISWSEAALALLKAYHKDHATFLDTFAAFPSNHLALVRHDGALDLYHGVIRAVDATGKRLVDDVDTQEYLDVVAEEVRSWTYMKFPFIKKLGKEHGWYRVGPLARLNVCDFIPTPLAQREFEQFRAYTNGKPNNMSMHYHWARLIEVLHAAEVMKELLNDPDLQSEDLVTQGTRREQGIGIIEAPRGTLFHHYKVNEQDLITMCNLIVSTTNNNEPMNRAVNSVAVVQMTGQQKITEGMMNAVEVAIRAYDPCLSCATHAMGQMPLEVTLQDASGAILDHKRKNM